MGLKKKKNQGFSLLEAILALAMMSLIGGTLMPLWGKMRNSNMELRVKKQLFELKEGLEWYAYENDATFPTTLTDSGFINQYVNEGVNFGTDDNGVCRDPFNPGSDFQYSYSGTPSVAFVWSVGPDGTDDTHADDDLWVEVASEPLGRLRTRNKHTIISAKAAWRYRVYGRAYGNTWTVVYDDHGTSAGLFYDGFGTGWLWGPTTATYIQSYLIFSYGPDEALNSGTSACSIGTGDDQRM